MVLVLLWEIQASKLAKEFLSAGIISLCRTSIGTCGAAILLLFFCVPSVFSQSTTVSASIQDTSGQLWKQGTFTFTFRPAPSNPTGPYFWAGSPFNLQQSILGHMDTSGAFSVSVPSNTSITPSGSTWDVQVCPISQGNTTCYTKQSVTITGATQSLSSSVRPPPALIDLAHPAYPFVMSYTNAEFTTAPMGGIYYDYTQSHYFLCTQVTPTGQAQWYGSCLTWKEFCLVGDGLCSGATTSWFLNNVLVGTEPNYDVIPGTNITITATDDPGATRVHYTINASGSSSGLTACSLGLTNPSTSTWGTEAAGTLQTSNFVNSSFGAGFGWVPVSSGNGNGDVCSSLYMINSGVFSSNPWMASGDTNNRIVSFWGPTFGFQVGTCGYMASTTGAGGFFPSDAGCVAAVGNVQAYYNLSWSNSNTHGTCASQLGNGGIIPPAVFCSDSSNNKLTLASTGLSLKNSIGTVSVLPNASTAVYNFVLPINAGSNTQVLTTDGVGNTSWSGSSKAILAAPTTCNLGSDITGISSNTPTNLINCATTAPSSGCPCRAIVSWSIIGDGTSSTEQATAKVSDGTSDFGWAAGDVDNQISSGYKGINRSATSPNTYANGASVTFTLTGESDHTWNVRAVSTFLSAPTQVQVTYFSSN